MSSTIYPSSSTSPYWKAPVASVAALPASGETIGEVRLVLDIDELYEWNGSSWQAISGGGGGSGDVVGPASATDNAITRFDSTTGKLIQNSAGTLSDAGIISTAGALLTGLTASRAVQTDASKNLESSAVTSTELGYVSGVTSAIQTQINSKQASDATLTALAAYNTNGILTQTAADTFAGRTITGTANEITVTNGDGGSGNPTLSLPTGIDAAKIADGSVSSTEFQYISTLSSNAQTQLNAKADLVSPSFTTPSLGAATATQLDLTAQGDLRLQDSSGGEYVAIQAPATVTTYTITMPAAVPGAGQALVDAGAGNGVMAWASAGGGTSTPTASTTAQWDANVNMSANSLINGYTTTAKTTGTTTLTATSTRLQFFTGTQDQNLVLPVTSTLVLGQQFEVADIGGSNPVVVKSSGGNIISTLAATTGTRQTFTCILTSGTDASSWSASRHVSGPTSATNSAIATFATGGSGMQIQDSSTTIATTPSSTAVAKWTSNLTLNAANFVRTYTTTATAAGTTTLTAASTYYQFFTGATTQNCKMPVTSTLSTGFCFRVVNNSSGAVTIQSSGTNTIATANASTVWDVICILTTGTDAASWFAHQIS